MEIKQKPALAQSLKVIHSVVNLEFISFISAGETKKRVQDTNFSFSVFFIAPFTAASRKHCFN